MKQKFWALAIIIPCFQAKAQTAGEAQKRFPDAEASYSKISCNVSIVRENGKLLAQREYAEDLVHHSENSVKMMSRGYIYHSGFSELKNWDAFTLHPGNKKKLKVTNANTTSSRQSYIFYDDAKATSFDYPGGSIGSIHHLEYQLQNKDVSLLSPFYFERYFPVLEGELQVSFPSDVKLGYKVKGLHANKVSFAEVKKKDRTIYIFRVSDLEGIRSYDDAPDNAWYATHLIFYIEQVKEEGRWINFLSNPDDLYRHNYEHIRQVNTSLTPELKSITDSLVSKAKDDREKARQIYNWVQKHIKYVAFEEGMEGFVPRDAGLVCSRRFGDCKDMTSILTTMLKHAGVSAYFTWIGTRDIPYDYRDVPLPITDNHMICTAKIGPEYIFLDGTDSWCVFGVPSSGIQGKEAMIAINEKEYRIEKVPVVPAANNSYSDSTFLQLSEQGITGKIKVGMKGYFASNMHSSLSYRNDEERKDYFKRRFSRANNKISFTNWKIEGQPGNEELWITADFTLPGYAKKLGDEWFVNMNLFKWYEHEEIDYPKRKIPIEFSFLENSRFVTVVTVPEGFRVGHVPTSETFKNDTWGFVMNYSSSGDRICLTQEFETRQLMLAPDKFESWNKVLEKLYPHYKQTISLQKK